MQVKSLAKGARRLILQKFVPSENLPDNSSKNFNYTDDEFENFRKIIKDSVSDCFIR